MPDKFLLVAAIDFGTAYSGYAFSTVADYEKDPLKVCANTWNSGTLMSLKTSTSVLFNENKNFHSFGFDAEDKYSNLALDKEHLGWYFFRRFKMRLFDKMTLTRGFLIEDETGKLLPALDVFSACIKFMKDHLIKRIGQMLPDTNEDDIRFVLTVPAIWNEAAKQFMREAASKAGIVSSNMLIALEPEAASLCCRYLPMNNFKGCSDGFVPFSPRSKYLVFDAGGGTVDITVHEVQANKTLKELYKANGGSWGGTYIDKAFRKLLTAIVGENVMVEFTKENMMDLIDLFREFEVRKRTFKNEMAGKITFKVPIALNERFKKKNGKPIKDHIETLSEYKNKITWTGDKLRIDFETARALFKDACESASKHLKSLFEVEEVADVPTILMVGGFSESPMLQDVVRNTFPDKKVIVPADPGLAVLRGAVIFGHEPHVIQERRCRYTYGVDTSVVFKDGVHLEAKRHKLSDGREFCEDIFDRHVNIGQIVANGEKQTMRSYTPVSADQTSLAFNFYASTDREPMYVTEASCTKIGSLTVDIAGSGLDREVTVQLAFGDTELHVEVIEKDTKTSSKAKLDFLG